MNKLFQQVVGNRPNKNAFDLSHERKFSMNMGNLVPILCEPVIPGDTWRCNTEILMRFAPMISPVMHRINCYTHFFFVPNRLIWSEWEDFITGGKDGQQTPEMPYMSFTAGTGDAFKIKAGSLADYLGHASTENLGVTTKINALAFRAYTKIFNDYYRDQNLQDEFPFSTGSGLCSNGDKNTITAMRTRAWEKDYFTSALPWTQRGGDVHLPLQGNAEVIMSGDTFVNGGLMRKKDGTDAAQGAMQINTYAGTAPPHIVSDNDNLENLVYDPQGSLMTDLSAVTSTTVEELRRATKLQQWLERNARGGGRYIEQILVHFGVHSSDKRLQRPEYLGGGRNPITVSEVLQTSGPLSDDTTELSKTPLGEMGGHAIGIGNSHRFKKFFEEHGYIIGIMSVLPKTAYFQGTKKDYLKTDKFEYYFPEFAQLGEQPVDIKELYQDYSSTEDKTFGYQSRYAEYKYIPSSCHGDFKNDSLKHWHMGREFTSEPVLNNQFVTSNPTQRIFAVEDYSVAKLYVQVYNNIKAIRPIPKFNNPSLL